MDLIPLRYLVGSRVKILNTDMPDNFFNTVGYLKIKNNDVRHHNTCSKLVLSVNFYINIHNTLEFVLICLFL